MTTKYLKPAPGRAVYQMDGKPWPADGMDAENSLFVRRRLKDGDLIEAERPVAIVEPAAEAETTETTETPETETTETGSKPKRSKTTGEK